MPGFAPGLHENSGNAERSYMEPPAKSFRDLLVWRKAHEFVLAVYPLTAIFPKSEIYGLAGQMRRAAVSIPANIAEGFRRRGRGDKVRFLDIAEGSLEECHYYLILAQDLGYADATELTDLANRVGRLLTAYSKAIIAQGEVVDRNKPTKPRSPSSQLRSPNSFPHKSFPSAPSNLLPSRPSPTA